MCLSYFFKTALPLAMFLKNNTGELYPFCRDTFDFESEIIHLLVMMHIIRQIYSALGEKYDCPEL